MKKLVCLCLFGLLGINFVNAQYLKKGDIAPDFKVTTSDGTAFHLAGVVKEKYVPLDFSAV